MQRIDTNGRIGIPKNLRERVGIDLDTSLEMYESNGVIVVKPKKETYEMTPLQLSVIRELYDIIKSYDILDETKLGILRETARISDLICPECGSNMYVNNNKTFECPNCK